MMQAVRCTWRTRAMIACVSCILRRVSSKHMQDRLTVSQDTLVTADPQHQRLSTAPTMSPSVPPTASSSPTHGTTSFAPSTVLVSSRHSSRRAQARPSTTPLGSRLILRGASTSPLTPYSRTTIKPRGSAPCACARPRARPRLSLLLFRLVPYGTLRWTLSATFLLPIRLHFTFAASTPSHRPSRTWQARASPPRRPTALPPPPPRSYRLASRATPPATC